MKKQWLFYLTAALMLGLYLATVPTARAGTVTTFPADPAQTTAVETRLAGPEPIQARQAQAGFSAAPH